MTIIRAQIRLNQEKYATAAVELQRHVFNHHVSP
jgi:hypothetical protein